MLSILNWGWWFMTCHPVWGRSSWLLQLRGCSKKLRFTIEFFSLSRPNSQGNLLRRKVYIFENRAGKRRRRERTLRRGRSSRHFVCVSSEFFVRRPLTFACWREKTWSGHCFYIFLGNDRFSGLLQKIGGLVGRDRYTMQIYGRMFRKGWLIMIYNWKTKPGFEYKLDCWACAHDLYNRSFFDSVCVMFCNRAFFNPKMRESLARAFETKWPKSPEKTLSFPLHTHAKKPRFAWHATTKNANFFLFPRMILNGPSSIFFLNHKNSWYT